MLLSEPPHVDPLFRVVAPPVRVFTPAVVFTNKTNIHTRENETSSEELQTFLVVGVTCESPLGGVPPRLMGSPLGDTRYWGKNYWGKIWYHPLTSHPHPPPPLTSHSHLSSLISHLTARSRLKQSTKMTKTTLKTVIFLGSARNISPPWGGDSRMCSDF